MNTVSIDVGGTMIKHALIDEKGIILKKQACPTPDEKAGFLALIVHLVKEYEQMSAIRAVAFSFPGYINPSTGFAETAGAIVYFAGQNIKQQVESALDGRYPVYIENDANCAALAERHSGNGQDAENFFVMTVGTGIGGALFINGELYRGFQYKAGEYGRMRINHALAPEKTMHDFSSLRVLIKQYKELNGLTALDLVTGEQILDEAQEKEETRKLVEAWIDTLCIGMFNVVTVLNPERILVGGGISSHPAFLPMIRERLHRIWDWHEFQAPIMECRYFNDAGILGAYYHAMQQEKQLQ